MPACTQSVYEVYEHQKSDLLVQFLKSRSAQDTTLIFLRSREAVHQITSILNRESISVESIHGTTKPEQRLRALNDLKEKKIRALIATNAIVENLDLTGIRVVIYYDFHERNEDYLARLESTQEEVITFVTQHEQNLLIKLETLVGMELPRRQVQNFKYDAQPKYQPPVRPKGYKPNKTGSKPLQHKKPKLKNKGPRRKTGRTRKR